MLSEAWALYTRFFPRFVLAAAVVFVVLDLVSAVAQAAGDDVLSAILWSLVSLVVSIVGFFWVQGALVEAVRDARDGTLDASISELYARTRPRVPALISAGLIAGLAIGLSAITVLLIPLALFLIVRWLFITPAIVLEGRSAGESFGRSSAISRGHGWTILWLVVVTLVFAALAYLLVVALFAWLPSFIATWLGGTVAHSLVSPFVVLVWTIAYYRLLGAGRAPAAA